MYLVQIIALIVYATVMISAVRNFKHTVLVWIPLSFLFNPQICIWYNGSGLALTVAVNISLCLFYVLFAKKRIKCSLSKEGFFLSPAVKIMFFSYLISILFSQIPFALSFNKTIKLFIETYGLIFILFKCLKTKDDILIFTKASVVVAILITINGIIENFTHINIAGDFIYMNSPHTIELNGRSYYYPSFVTGHVKERFGLTRCYSFFGLHIHFGLACTLLFFLITSFVKNKTMLLNNTLKSIKGKTLPITIGLLCIGVVLCNSKGPMLGFCIMLLVFYRLKDILNIKIILPLIIGIALILIYIPDYINNFIALADEDVAEEGGGSTIALREQQMRLCLKIFEMNPICGMGIGSAGYFSKNISGFEGILGAESCWLKLLPDQGIIGCFAYLFMYKVLWTSSIHIMPKRVILFFLLAVFVMDSVGGSPSSHILWWIGIFLVVRKLYQLNNQRNANKKIFIYNSTLQ